MGPAIPPATALFKTQSVWMLHAGSTQAHGAPEQVLTTEGWRESITRKRGKKWSEVVRKQDRKEGPVSEN